MRERAKRLRRLIADYGIYNTAKVIGRYLTSHLITLHLGISASCNINCVQCSLREFYEGSTIMPLSLFNNIEKELGNIPRVRLGGGGEPLIHPNFTQILEKTREHSCLVNFNTNGMLLNENIAKKLVKNKVEWIGVSIDGANATTNNSIRRGSDLERIIANVIKLQEIKAEIGQEVPRVEITFVATKRNYEELPKVISLASKLGVEKVGVNGIEPYSREMAKEALYLDGIRKEAHKVFKLAKEKAEKLNLSLRLPNLTPRKPSCSLKCAVIMPDGDVCPCGSLSYRRPVYLSVEGGRVKEKRKIKEKKTFGNIEEEPLEAIYRKDEFVEFRERVSRGDFPPECDSCLMKYKLIC